MRPVKHPPKSILKARPRDSSAIPSGGEPSAHKYTVGANSSRLSKGSGSKKKGRRSVAVNVFRAADLTDQISAVSWMDKNMAEQGDADLVLKEAHNTKNASPEQGRKPPVLRHTGQGLKPMARSME